MVSPLHHPSEDYSEISWRGATLSLSLSLEFVKRSSNNNNNNNRTFSSREMSPPILARSSFVVGFFQFLFPESFGDSSLSLPSEFFFFEKGRLRFEFIFVFPVSSGGGGIRCVVMDENGNWPAIRIADSD